MAAHVVFVCVANRVRSPFAEFLLTDTMGQRGEDITMSSAGYVPQMLKDQLAGANVGIPEPFFNRPMSELTRAALLEKGISVPNGWRSKELSLEIIKEADLIFTALAMQKEELSSVYKDFRNKIFTISDLSGRNDYLFSEDFSVIPFNDNFWHSCEEDPEYVLKVLKEWEETLTRALPNIIKKLRFGSEEENKALT